MSVPAAAAHSMASETPGQSAMAFRSGWAWCPNRPRPGRGLAPAWCSSWAGELGGIGHTMGQILRSMGLVWMLVVVLVVVDALVLWFLEVHLVLVLESMLLGL